MASRRATAADVAEAAGVSKTAVSYAFSPDKQHKLTEATRQRVLSVADSIGYRPNPTAQALRHGSSKVALALLPDWDMGPSWAVMIQGMGDLFAQHGFALVAASAASAETIPLWRQLAPAAVMVLGDLSPALATELADEHVPVIDVDMRGMLREGGRIGAAALHAAGHERLGYLLPSTHVPREIEQYRFEGIEDYCRANGLPAPARRVIEYSEDGVRRVRGAWFDSDAKITGVVAHTDEVGIFLYLSLKDAGVEPGSIGIIGVGDRPLSVLGLTTIAFEPSVRAHRLAEGALAVLEEREPQFDGDANAGQFVIYRDSLPMTLRATS